MAAGAVAVYASRSSVALNTRRHCRWRGGRRGGVGQRGLMAAVGAHIIGGAGSGNVGLWLPSARTLLSRAIVSEVGPKKMPRRSRLSINVHPGTIAQWL